MTERIDAAGRFVQSVVDEKMRLITTLDLKQFGLVLSLLLGVSIWLSCGGTNFAAHPASPDGEILYIINKSTISAYSIEPDSLAATLIEQPVPLVPVTASLVQFVPSLDDRFVYSLWSDGQNVQHLSVFQTDASGVPKVPAIQVLNADSLSQFNMHPNGQFAYMLELTSSKNGYEADIRLFNVQADGGMLKENPKVQGTYGPSNIWPAFLYGFSEDGSKLYDTSMVATGAVYRERSINLTNGALGGDKQIFSASGEQDIVIGKVIVDQYRSGSSANENSLNIFPNTSNPSRAIIHCTMAMLSFCATATNVQLDSSGHYLFLTDPATQAVHVASIDLSSGKVRDTGNSIPMTSQTPGFVFSPDGSIVYAMLASDRSVHFYAFDRASGSLSEGGTPLALASDSGICPAQHQ
jgi:hypothetical protein